MYTIYKKNSASEKQSLVWSGQFVGRSLRIGKDSRVHIWSGWQWYFAQQQTIHMNRLSWALGGVSYHHHQWRFERFDAPRSSPQALQLAESLSNRWPRPVQPHKLAYIEGLYMSTFVIIRLL